ncbi:MAG TPA: methyltransferase domain-containing protein [Mycobacteriales bacterium]|nr:methyltransferase domain-containing protein [Mycobacteriales bacterium]
MRQPGTRRQPNDYRQYDDLAWSWWEPRGPMAMLGWIAEARARLFPPAPRPGALLVDLGCGGGLLAPHVRALGYRHVGVDLSSTAVRVAREHGVATLRGDVTRLPVADAVADAVSAGEILEHVRDVPAAVREACRILRPGGTLVLDTIAATGLARLLVVTVAEHIPGGAPPGIHDPALFVDRQMLRRECARWGVTLRLRGLRPSLPGMLRWLVRRAPAVRMIPTRPTSVLFQGYGVKEAR